MLRVLTAPQRFIPFYLLEIFVHKILLASMNAIENELFLSYVEDTKESHAEFFPIHECLSLCLVQFEGLIAPIFEALSFKIWLLIPLEVKKNVVQVSNDKCLKPNEARKRMQPILDKQVKFSYCTK